jgi:hypothetical protein
MSTFLAKYNTACPGAGCDEDIEVGDIVEWIEGQVVHEGCLPPAEVKPRPVCGECFMEITPSGACGCGVLT